VTLTRIRSLGGQAHARVVFLYRHMAKTYPGTYFLGRQDYGKICGNIILYIVNSKGFRFRVEFTSSMPCVCLTHLYVTQSVPDP